MTRIEKFMIYLLMFALGVTLILFYGSGKDILIMVFIIQSFGMTLVYWLVPDKKEDDNKNV